MVNAEGTTQAMNCMNSFNEHAACALLDCP